MLARRRRRVPLDPAALVRLYVEQGKSLEEMAREFGASESNVQRALARLEIARRARGWKREALCPEPGCSRPAFRPGNRSYHTGRRCRFHHLLHHARQNHLSRLRSRHTREIRRG
jgi:AraC-like DNA-binding protein